MQFNKEECIRLINALTNIHSANNNILDFVKKRAQQASAFGSKFLLSTMEGNTLDTLTDLKILYPNYQKENKDGRGAILFKIDDDHKIQIYQLENITNKDHNKDVLFPRKQDESTMLKALHLNGINRTIFIDTSDEEDLEKYYFIKGENDEVVAEGWNKKQKVATRSTQKEFSHWTKFAGMMERYINPNTNYRKFASDGGKNKKGSDTPVHEIILLTAEIGDLKTDTKSICTICGNPIDNIIDVDHCWNLRFNKYLGVIDDPDGYFDTHPDCNIKKSDKLYFPTDKVWDNLLTCAGYDESVKKNFNSWKSSIIDKDNYPNFTLNTDIVYNQEYFQLDIMDIKYLERLSKVDPKLTDYSTLHEAMKRDILIHVTSANIYMSLYEYFENSFDLTKDAYTYFFNVFGEIENDLSKQVEKRITKENEIAVEEIKKQVNVLIVFMKKKLEKYFIQKQTSDMQSVNEAIVNRDCGDVIRLVSQYAKPLSPSTPAGKVLPWSEDSLDKFIKDEEIKAGNFSLSTRERKYEYNSLYDRLGMKIDMLKTALKEFGRGVRSDQIIDCQVLLSELKKYELYRDTAAQIVLDKRKSIRNSRKGLTRKMDEQAKIDEKAKIEEKIKSEQQRQKKARAKAMAERRKNKNSNKQKQGGRKTRKKKRRRKKKTRRKRRRKKKKRTRRKK